MKRKSGFACLIFVLIGLLSFGCGNQSIEENTEGDTQTVEDNTESSDTSEEEDAELVDEEYLLEHCGVTKEELEGIDVEEFINYYQFTYKNIDNYNILLAIEMYRDKLERELLNTDEYSELFITAEKGGYLDEYEEEIRIVALSINLTYEETVLFDFDKGVYYYGGEGLSVIRDYSSATKSGELSEEDMEAVRECIREAKVSNWQAVFGEAEPDVLDGGVCWELGIVCSENQKYYYEGHEGSEGLDMYIKLMELIDVEVDEYLKD